MKKMCGLLMLFQLVLVSCNDTLLEEKQVACYFQYEYVNYAWGFNHSGFTITPAGELFSFVKTTPWVFAENGKLSLTALNKNLQASVKVDSLISKKDIAYYQQLALSAMAGKIGDPVNRGADMGALICKIIVPDTTNSSNGFLEIILSEKGDWERKNLAPEATLIAEWLAKLKFH